MGTKYNPVAEAFEAVQQTLDEECDPENLTKEQYKELLHDLTVDISGRLETITQELEEAKKA
jgi:hypothetical protein